MAKYVLTNKAVEDLSGIWHYTCEAWSENQADKYYHSILEHCQELVNHPGLDRVYEEIGIDIREFKINNHIIFYRIQNTELIEIIRILHSKMDLKRRFYK